MYEKNICLPVKFQLLNAPKEQNRDFQKTEKVLIHVHLVCCVRWLHFLGKYAEILVTIITEIHCCLEF